MPFVLAVIGITIFVTAVKGTTSTLFGLVKDDFTGSGNFLYWVLAIFVIGAVGYVKRLAPIANLFLLLVMVVLFIGAGNKGFFAQFMAAIKSPANNCGNNPSDSSITIDNGPINSLGPLNSTANGIVKFPSTVLDNASLGLLSGAGGNTGSVNLGNWLGNIISGNAFKPQGITK